MDSGIILFNIFIFLHGGILSGKTTQAEPRRPFFEKTAKSTRPTTLRQSPKIGDKNFRTTINSFESVIESGEKLTDKSEFIAHILNDGKIVHITRPRKWGKTFNKDMLETFLSHNKNSTRFFQKLNIYKPEYKSLRERYFNKRCVIKVDFSPIVDLSTYELAARQMNEAISIAFQPFTYLQKSAVLDEKEIEAFSNIKNGTAKEEQFDSSLGMLCKMLRKHHRVTNVASINSIILIDGIDTPLVTAFLYNYYDKMENKLYRLLEHLLMHSTVYFEKAAFLGVVPIFRCGKLKNFDDFSYITLFDFSCPYTTDFGLTKAELKILCYGFEMAGNISLSELEDKFGGYKIGGNMLYPAGAVIDYAHGKNCEYFYDSSSPQTKLAEKLLTQHGKIPAVNFQRMLLDEELTKPLHRNFSFKDVYYNETYLWSYLAHSGFIATSGSLPPSDLFQVKIKIPNGAVKRWVRKQFDILRNTGHKLPDYDKLIDALEKDDKKNVNELLSEYLEDPGNYLAPPDRKPNADDVNRYLKLILLGWSKIIKKNITSTVNGSASEIIFPLMNGKNITINYEI